MNAPAATVTPKKPKTRSPKVPHPWSSWAQLDLFGNDDQINFVRAMDNVDLSRGEVMVAIEADPSILAGAKDIERATEALSMARFLSTEGSDKEEVLESLQILGVEPTAVLTQLNKVKAIVDGDLADDLEVDTPSDDAIPGLEASYEELAGDDGDGDDEADSEDIERIVRKVSTGMADSALGALLRRIRMDRFAPMTVEEEIKLHERSRAGDARARNELIERNMRFLVSQARKFMYTGRELEWLVAAGQVGLVAAADKFDPARGRMASCAKWWIRQSIQRELGKDNLITTPAYMQPKANRLRKEAEEATSDDERAKLTAQADRLQAEINARRSQSVSMDASAGDDDSETSTMHNILEAECEGPEEALDRQRLVEKLVSFADNLPDERQRSVFLMRIGLHEQYFGEPRTLQDVATLYGVSRERIRQIYADAAQDVGTRVMLWAGGEQNLPDGFRKGLMAPGRG
ncbi:RNA polymerase sigma factor (sigma-70 family) [Roseateles asaccharophilus]|uniref:sigma-70 family RNA polymerase sigma factor n=1 Tax=Roseateles asaccharophilus TaxID=582607 RepID=UPI0038326722